MGWMFWVPGQLTRVIGLYPMITLESHRNAWLKRRIRFSELLSETFEGLLRPALSANSPHDLEKQRNIVYAMATCHSLRVVDGELLGDPLDVKMFQFTGWTYEEGGSHAPGAQTSPSFDTIAPSVAKPPATRSNTEPHSRDVSQWRGLIEYLLTIQLLVDSCRVGSPAEF